MDGFECSMRCSYSGRYELRLRRGVKCSARGRQLKEESGDVIRRCGGGSKRRKLELIAQGARK